MRSYSAAWIRDLLAGAFLLLCATPGIASDDAIAELQRAGRLDIDAYLSPSGPVVPGQKLTLTLQIATDRWFSGGTRITLPEVPGLVILQTEQFASNASERRGDSNWVLQRWTLDVFPQRPGEFTIPPIKTRLKINTEEAGDAEGIMASPPVTFTVTLPASLAELQHWVAAPGYTVSQSFDRGLEQLQVGDAFERDILFEASGVMAMMLPTFAAEDLPGLAAYPSPPVLDNSSNRGQTRATRRQKISYIVQAEGHYLLPARDFFWWDTARAELQVLSLPATEISVGTGTANVPGGDVFDALPITPRQLLAACAGLVALTALIWLARRFLPRIPLARLASTMVALRKRIRDLRKPALPERLNPGSSAGE